MDESYVFVASGDPCPVCSALDGTAVPAGFTAHENCRCQTIRKPPHASCRHHLVGDTNVEQGAQGHVIISYEIVVECPKGGEIGESVSLDVEVVEKLPLEALQESIDAAADRLCDACAEDSEDPFLCC